MSRCTKMGPGGNTTTNSKTNFIFNRYKGEGGIGASTIANRNAKNRLASFCKIGCRNLVTPQTTPTPPTPIPPTPTTPETILVYNTNQGDTFEWDGVTFTRTTDFSYTANISLIPSIPSGQSHSSVPSYKNLINVTIGNIVTSIGNGAFTKCISLTSITIPNSVTSIGNSVFSNCESLTSITIPNSVTSIGDNVFAFCISLSSITIPNSVTSIGVTAFDLCTLLISITIPTSVTSIGANAFTSSGLTTVTIANGQLGIPSPSTGVSFFGTTVNTVLP
jgi:hypothetical protein